MMLMGLRLTEGVSLTRYERRAGRPIGQQPIEILEENGLITRDGDCLKATSAGRPVLNSVLATLLA